MIEIEFHNIPIKKDLIKLIEKTQFQLFTHLKIETSSEVSLILGNNETLRKLNQRYRNKDRETDVLSFPNEGANPESGNPYIGDLAISLEKTLEQAKQGKHSFEAEIQLLTIHGHLHLLGYDHEKASDKIKMWELQNEILELLGVNIDQANIGNY